MQANFKQIQRRGDIGGKGGNGGDTAVRRGVIQRRGGIGGKGGKGGSGGAAEWGYWAAVVRMVAFLAVSWCQVVYFSAKCWCLFSKVENR